MDGEHLAPGGAKSVLSGGLLLAALLAVPALSAGTPATGPVPDRARAMQAAPPLEVVRERNRKIQRIVESAGDPLSDATRERLKDVINGLIDFRELSRRALGKHWDDRTAEEKREFVEVFRQLIRNSSVKKLGIYRADSLTYRPARVEGDEATVTTIAHKGRKTVEIVYGMHRTEDGWRVHDTVIDGASTVRTYRDSFYREIAQTSYRDTYQRLVQKLEEQRSEETASG